MGDRGQVFVKDVGIYLYTHWSATELVDTVRTALKRGEDRWDDAEYLARIIFCDMVRDDFDGLIGYGIGNAIHGDEWRVVTVDTEAQKVIVTDNGKVKLEETFEDFVKKATKVEEEG